MDYRLAAEALLRRKMLEDIYSRMSDEERRLYMQMSQHNRSQDEIKSALQQQQALLTELSKRQQTFGEDFASNILGNAAWDGTLWLVSRLFGKLR